MACIKCFIEKKKKNHVPLLLDDSIQALNSKLQNTLVRLLLLLLLLLFCYTVQAKIILSLLLRL